MGHRRVEGGLVFADISGYTRLSERLASRGRAGSEEAVELIDSVLRAIIDAIEARGGDVLDFAGDALVALFDGDDAPLRATSTAAAIRGWFDRRAADVTSVGRVVLRAAVAVATGPVDLVLAGSDEMVLCTAGPTATRLVLLERAASGGDVLVCETTAAALAGQVRLIPRGGGYLLPGSVTPAALIGADAAYRGVDPSEDLRLVPRPLRESVAGGTFGLESDHRLATMAFLVTGGLDQRFATDPADVARDLDDLFRAAGDITAQHGVTMLTTDVTADGVALFLGAGVPLATGNAEERMLRALRAILTTPVAERLHARAGTHRGPVFAGVVGAPHRAIYSAMGDTTNLAARLAFRALPGELLATSEVVSRSTVEFALEPAPEFRPKGKAFVVTPLRVGREIGRQGRTVERLPLVGRDRELHDLTDRLEAALAGAGGALTLVGEPGVGKSRLAAEILEDHRIRTRVVVRFTVGDESTPYAGLVRSLRDLAGLDEPDSSPAAEAATLGTERFAAWATSFLPEVGPWLPLLGMPFGIVLPDSPETARLAPRFRRRRLHEVVVGLMVAVLGPGSVLLLEDLHWSDEASTALLHELATRAEGEGWLVLALSRDSDTALDRHRYPMIELTGLGSEAVAALAVAATAATPLSDAELRSIVERGAGNPLFVRELATATADRANPSEELPGELEQLLAARIDRLAPTDRALLRRAAVLGRSVDLGVLAQILPGDEHVQDVTRWGALGEFVEWSGAGHLRYRHDLFCQAAYAGLAERVRRDLHARAAEVIERHAGAELDGVAAVLAGHHARAGSHVEAFRFGRRAADLARAQVAHVDALGLYERSLSSGVLAGVDKLELAQVAEALGDVAELAGRYDRAMSGYAAARRLRRAAAAPGVSGNDGAAQQAVGLPPDALARAARKSGVVCERMGRYPQALAWYSRAERLLADTESLDGQRARLLLDRAGVRQRQGRPADTVTLALAAAATAERLGDLELQAHAYYLLHAAYGDLGRREAVAYRDLALPIYEQLGDLVGQGNVLNNLGVDAYFEGRWVESLDYYRRSHEARERVGDVANAATESNNEAEILSDQGHLAEARTLFENALRVWRAAGFEIGVALVTSNLGRLTAREGRAQDALPILREALDRFEALGSQSFVQETNARLAETLLLAGHVEEAADLARTVLDKVRRSGEDGQLAAPLERTLGWCHLDRGETSTAAQRFAASLEAARRAESPFDIALTRHAQLALPSGALGAQEREVAADEARRLLDGLGVTAVVEPEHGSTGPVPHPPGRARQDTPPGRPGSRG